jgi:hypothetical protein
VAPEKEQIQGRKQLEHQKKNIKGRWETISFAQYNTPQRWLL